MRIKNCRVCDSVLTELLSLGEMNFSGIFPANPYDVTPKGELKLMLCSTCSLVQLSENFPSDVLYGQEYGYRSGLNDSMVTHIKKIVNRVLSKVPMSEGDIFLDIGSNDGTLLNSINERHVRKIGIDPTILKFADFYDRDIEKIPDFFSFQNYMNLAEQKAKIITSIAMFYDLERPVEFVSGIRDVLANDGIWYLEQSYLPSMVERNAYDTICHEHIEYYSLTSIKFLLDLVDLKIIDLELNNSNGGSIGLYVTHKTNNSIKTSSYVEWLNEYEKSLRINSPEYFQDFKINIEKHPGDLSRLINLIKQDGGKILGIGASTKGSILAQHCKLTSKQIPKIGEINDFKYGKYMGGTDIPIVNELEVLREKPDYILVFPWHFHENLKSRFSNYLQDGGKLILPLPKIEVISF